MEIKINLGVPSEKQKLFLKDTHRYVAFGGARGGGKSFALRYKAVVLALKHSGIKITIVRRTYQELIENHIKPLKALLRCGLPNSVARYNDSRKEFTFVNGSTITLKYCGCDRDLDGFQGLEEDVLMVDEATLLSEYQLNAIGATVRGTGNYPRRTYYTCNPNGQSLALIKRLFIDREFKEGEYPEDYSFIQSLVTDNVALMKSNPEYLRQLESLPPKIRDAWLYGRWDVYEGLYFETFRTKPDTQKCEEAGISVEDAYREGRWTNVIEPFEIPSDWKIFRSYDWGYGKPFSFCWWAMDREGILYQILEWYGCTNTPNEGVRMTNAEQFKYVQELENTHRWLKGKRIEGVADPSIWDGSHDTDGISCAETAEKYGIFFEKGNNERIAGWMQVRERMQFDTNGKAMLYFFDTCKHSIRTIPLMLHDEKRVEDLDTTLEDHICDSIRYQCMQHIIPPRLIKQVEMPVSDPLNQYEQYRNKDRMIVRR